MRRTHITATLAVAMAAAAAASATPAMAAEPTCRASALRVSLGTLTLNEPVVANPGETNCYTTKSALGTIAAETSGGSQFGFTHGHASVFYGGTAVFLPGVLEFAQASSVYSSAGASCSTSGGPTDITGTSTVHEVYVTPSFLAPPIVLEGKKPQTIQIPGVGTLYVNREVKTATSVVRQALFLDTAAVDTVVAESKASARC